MIQLNPGALIFFQRSGDPMLLEGVGVVSVPGIDLYGGGVPPPAPSAPMGVPGVGTGVLAATMGRPLSSPEFSDIDDYGRPVLPGIDPHYRSSISAQRRYHHLNPSILHGIELLPLF